MTINIYSLHYYKFIIALRLLQTNVGICHRLIFINWWKYVRIYLTNNSLMKHNSHLDWGDNMDTAINLQAAFVGTLLGIMLMMVVIWNNTWRFKDRRTENKCLSVLIVSVLVACILDYMCCVFDGSPGPCVRLFLYLGNTLLLAIDVILCCGWIAFIMIYLVGNIARGHIMVLVGAIALSSIILLYNLFDPIVFYIDEYNRYWRGPYGDAYFGIAAFLLFFFFCEYKYIVHKGGGLKLFPIASFLLPVVVGIVVQMQNYGILLVWPTAAVSLTAVTLSLQNDMIFRDNLTGVYNRQFFDKISSLIKSKHQFGLIFLDLNRFKSINDTLGHDVGDEVLKKSARLMKRAVGASGTVIRYGGDEFIMLINTTRQAEVEEFLQRTKREFAAYNEVSGKPYKLSVSGGCTLTTLQAGELQKAVKRADELMYVDKIGTA